MGGLMGCAGALIALVAAPVLVLLIIADPVPGLITAAFLVWVCVHSWRRETRMQRAGLGVYKATEQTDGLEQIPTGPRRYVHPEDTTPVRGNSLDDFDDEEELE